MDMLRFPANNNVLVPYFSAHWNCAEFERISEIAMLQKHENLHVFLLFTTDVFLSHATTRAENSPPGCFCRLDGSIGFLFFG